MANHDEPDCSGCQNGTEDYLCGDCKQLAREDYLQDKADREMDERRIYSAAAAFQRYLAVLP